MVDLLAIDIETTGLTAETDRIVAVGFANSTDVWSFAKDDEITLLHELRSAVDSALPGVIIVTWNGEEFDLPFIAERFRFHGLGSGPRLIPKKGPGKYGGRRFRATWLGHQHLDIAPFFESYAIAAGIQWSLKPVATHLGLEPVLVDRRGEAIASLTRDQIQSYVESDARITLTLASRLLASQDPRQLRPSVWQRFRRRNLADFAGV